MGLAGGVEFEAAERSAAQRSEGLFAAAAHLFEAAPAMAAFPALSRLSTFDAVSPADGAAVTSVDAFVHSAAESTHDAELAATASALLAAPLAELFATEQSPSA